MGMSMNKVQKRIYVLFVVVILILSAFIVVVQFQIKKVTKEEELPLLVKVFVDKEEGYKLHGVNFTSLVLYYEEDLK